MLLRTLGVINKDKIRTRKVEPISKGLAFKISQGCLAVFLFILLVSGFCWAGEIDLNIIAYIESRNNPFAINFRTQCYGKYQVSQVCLTEYNQFNKTAYILTDMFNESLCERVALWYLNKRIPQMLRYFNKPTTTDNILWAYNAGIKRVVDNYMPNQTRNYIIKYKKLMESK